MARIALLILTASLAAASHAGLAPDRPAPLAQHFTEVNAQWPRMDPAVLRDGSTARFSTDAARIAAHLHAVHDRLTQRAPQGVAADALAQRGALLDALQGYADRGLFPINDRVPGRSPIFIDAVGTPCAVGFLMITSGHGDLAQRIHDAMNTAYVLDMHDAAVAEWASAHGFTADELAWIQPTYEFKHEAPRVLASCTLANGDVLVVQAAGLSRGVQQMQVIRRSSEGDASLAVIPAMSGVCALECNGRIYVSGVPAARVAADLYEWKGGTWEAQQVFTDPPGIHVLRVVNGELHAFGKPLPDASSAEKRLTADGHWLPVQQPVELIED